MKKLYLFIFALLLINLGTVAATVDSINYPHNNDIISYTAKIKLNVSSSGSTGCIFNYVSSLGAVPYNQTVLCDGVSLVDLPNADGNYNLTVLDDVGDSQTITIKVIKPNGILVAAIYTLTFFLLLSILFVFILNLAKLATTSTTIYDVAISMTVYFGLLISYQLIIEYSAVPFIIDWLDLIRSIAGWVLVMLPLISFVVTFFVKGTQKKKPLSVQEILGGRYD